MRNLKGLALFITVTALLAQPSFADHPETEIGYDRSVFTQQTLDSVAQVTKQLSDQYPPAFYPKVMKASEDILIKLVSSDLYKNFNQGTPTIKVRTVEEKIANAMAAGDGRVYVFAPIMEVLKSDDEMAAVLAHELAHVTRAHQERIVEFLMDRGIDLSGQSGNPDLFKMAQVMMMDLPKFKREMEQEADEVGLELLVAAGYPAAAMARAFTSLLTYQEQQKAKAAANNPQPKQAGPMGGLGDMLKDIMASHPPLNARIGSVFKESNLHGYDQNDPGAKKSKMYSEAQQEVRIRKSGSEKAITPSPFPINP